MLIAILIVSYLAIAVLAYSGACRYYELHGEYDVWFKWDRRTIACAIYWPILIVYGIFYTLCLVPVFWKKDSVK
jgi:hypothetical protein